MDLLSIYGFCSVSMMLVFYALEAQSHWYVLAFSLACAMSSIYGFLQGAWPFGLIEGIWMFVAFRRWINMKRDVYKGDTGKYQKIL